MPSDEEQSGSLRKALTSVYFHGRREEIEKTSVTLSRRVMSLEKAIDVLEGAGADGLHALRLALGDLIRTRASSKDPRLDRHIRRLSTRLGKLHDMPDPEVDSFKRNFDFDRSNELLRHPHDAYREAMKHMHRIHYQRSGRQEIAFPLARHESHGEKVPPFSPVDYQASESGDTTRTRPRRSPRRKGKR